MTKEELFKKYGINETHNEWDASIDNWVSVEIFRVMHDGRLPTADDLSPQYITDFQDKLKANIFFQKLMMQREDFGSMYLTSKRMTYMFAEIILEEINA